MMKNVKRRIEKLEQVESPQQFEEIKIINTLPGVLFEKYGKEFTIRCPKKRR